MDQLLRAQEELTCRLLLDFAKSYYSDPENRLHYELWLHQRTERDRTIKGKVRQLCTLPDQGEKGDLRKFSQFQY